MKTYVIMPNEDLYCWWDHDLIKNGCGSLLTPNKTIANEMVKELANKIATELPQYKGAHLDLLVSSNGTWGNMKFVESVEIE